MKNGMTSVMPFFVCAEEPSRPDVAWTP